MMPKSDGRNAAPTSSVLDFAGSPVMVDLAIFAAPTLASEKDVVWHLPVVEARCRGRGEQVEREVGSVCEPARNSL